MEKQTIGVVGLGGIAQKAYLPVYATLQDQYYFVLTTRDHNKLTALQAKYNFKATVPDLAALIAQQPVAVMVHTATASHAMIVRTLLLHDINVFVDKPLSENLAEVEALYALAEERHLMLTVGFNRRFAPMNANLHELGVPNQLIVEKNRIGTYQPWKFVVYDLMLHMFDTALFLAPTAAYAYGNVQVDADGNLLRATATLALPQGSAFVTMNMVTGYNDEHVRFNYDAGLVDINNLTSSTWQAGTSVQVEHFPDWTPTLEVRGFAPMVKAFLVAVTEHGKNPVDPTSAIATHRLADQFITDIQNKE
ncbi:Gfo/Idh/MocA family oxidoreductase [Periweissella cryptocerci]|uniref:Gfo/Idh/MocA family oxidoreductase n=1 Tax=Periweissella cryptocerci TaxID=2506420 RepID=A0A4P6YSM2_9LACO|nr:Gfo/Idh/MocA family oxidoreductase [Periweissella cryptocerci]QBO35627.1 Gfo/Idh/MocA family oxidoreductase [Periweissella cryptocerci]